MQLRGVCEGWGGPLSPYVSLSIFVLFRVVCLIVFSFVCLGLFSLLLQ